jgi:hypothetical protein
MSRGDHVHRWVRQLVLQSASKNLELTAREFRDKLAPEISAKGFPVPGVDWFRKRMRQVRDVQDDQDKPWSLGALASPVHVQIPNEAVPDISAVWKMCLISGQPFTVRQARWVARLRGLVPEHTPGQDDRVELHRWASTYSGREIAHMAEAAKSLDHSRRSADLDTSDMDAALMMSSDVNHALVATGAVGRFTSQYRLLVETAPQLVRNYLWWSQQVWELTPDERRSQFTEDADFRLDCEDIIRESSERTADKDQDSRRLGDAVDVWWIWVYSMMHSGTKWGSLTVERGHEIMLETLRQAMALYVDRLEHSLWNIDDPWVQPFSPSEEILDEVGHTVQER